MEFLDMRGRHTETIRQQLKNHQTFPRVPTTDDPEYKHSVANWHLYVDQSVRDKYVAAEKFYRLGERLNECCFRAGYNAAEDCKWLKSEYYRVSECDNYICDDDPYFHKPIDMKYLEKIGYYEDPE